MNYREWTNKAIDIIQTKISLNQPFELKSLFANYEWEKLTVNDRRAFGRYFSIEVKEGRVKNIQRVEPGPSGHSRYIKTKEMNK